jgi:hypothetical protein
MTTSADAFEHIIRHQTTQQLLPFLLALPKPDIVPVRQKTLSLKKELEEYKQYEVKPGKLEWTCLMTNEQASMLFLAGLATYSRKEALARGFDIRWTLDWDGPTTPTAANSMALRVLEHTRPDWLAAWMIRFTRANPWSAPAYRVLRTLEARGLLAHEPWLVAQSVAHILVQYNWVRTRGKGQDIDDYDQVILTDLRADATLLARDLPLLFDFDTMADSASTYSGKARTTVSWLTLLPQLAQSGHLDRADLLTRCLLALRRDFRRPLLTWFKEVYLALQPTAAERLSRQVELMELLAHPLPLVINFAIEQLKDLWDGPDFQPETLLLYADNLMTRQDLKTGVKTLLGAFGKLAKAQPARAAGLARLCTAALSHADAAVQERAAKVLADIIGAKNAPLSVEETAEISQSISAYADLLAPAARTVLARWLTDAPAPLTPTEMPEAYVPRLDFVPEISPATAIAPVADWHELLFLTGQVLQHDDPAALERWLDSLLRLRPQFPADSSAALRPYVLQIFPYLKDRPEAEQHTITASANFSGGYPGLVQALTMAWAQGFATPFVSKINLQSNNRTASPLVLLEQHRLGFAEQLLRTQRALPLLSTPSHAPHWVAPTVLVQRLLAYQAASQEANPTDLTIALARTAHAHRSEADAALSLLPQLQHPGLQELLRWLLSSVGTPLPAAVAGQKSLLRQFTERLGKLLPASALTVPSTLAEALPWLWAVAARTQQPAGEFPELAGLTAVPCPGVVRPWQPGWELQRQSNTYVVKWKPGEPEVTDHWTELRLLPEPTSGTAPCGLLIYSLHTSFTLREPHHHWLHVGPLATDFPFLIALLPQHPAPLYWHTLRLAATRDAVDSTTRTVISQALRSLLEPGPRFDAPVSVVLAVGLTHNAALCRALALEVLLAAVENQRLEPAALGQALGRLLAAEYVPLQRLTDSLTQARAISPTTDDALRQTLDALLPELPTEPPRNVRKLLEAYADLLNRTRQPAPAVVQGRLREWQAQASLKKVVAALLS